MPFLYERPPVSPWIGLDAGIAAPVARADENGVWYGGGAFMGGISAGVTLFSRFAVSAERSGMNVLLADEQNSAMSTMLTFRAGTMRGLALKTGIGKARYKLGPTLLVDDQTAWMLGGEWCSLYRVDACGFFDYSQTGRSSDRMFNADVVHYRLRTVRAGMGLRLHFLKGRRVTLPPR
jgi:hypothetical protein